MKKILYIIFLLSFLSIAEIKADTLIQIKPLFEYPVAPDEMESLSDKCDYLVKHFWDNFNFKQKNPVDQYALNEAFSVFVTSIRYASKKEVDQSIDKMLGKLASNPALLYQFTKAAEENLYGPRADIWNDEIYLKFVDALLKNKKISEKRKEKYIKQAVSLRESNIGNIAPAFEFTDLNGETKNYFPMSTPTVLIFGNPEDTDWRLARLKIESNFKLEDAIKKGKINVLFIIPFDAEGWQNSVSNYNSYWTVGQSKSVADKYDTRVYPSIYIVGPEGKILKKMVSVEDSIEAALSLVN